VIGVYDDAGNVIETHEHAGDFKNGEWFIRIASSNAIERLFGLPGETAGGTDISDMHGVLMAGPPDLGQNRHITHHTGRGSCSRF
jgi:hypothetical protein